MENNNELEMMRAQVALLKEKLDKEQMVSERMMRTVIKKEMGSFSRDRMLLILFAAAVMPFMLWMLICHDRISVALAAAMELYMIAAVLLGAGLYIKSLHVMVAFLINKWYNRGTKIVKKR